VAQRVTTAAAVFLTLLRVAAPAVAGPRPPRPPEAGDPAMEEYRVKVLSTMFLIDRDGDIVRRWTGTVDMADVRRSVDAQLEGGTAD
jgi:hypothetical protein